MFRRFVVSLAILVVGSSACQKNIGGGNPQQRLKQYIELTFNIRGLSDRKNLEEFLVGEAKGRLAGWSDEQFSRAFVDQPREFQKLVFKEVKEISPQEVSITYELTYLDKVKNVKITHKKICFLTYSSAGTGKWMIREAKNIKELIEYENEMTFP